MRAVTVYGITNCDTVKKARAWLVANKVEHRFHDFKKDGLTSEQAKEWLEEVGAEALINRRGNTWRMLSKSEQLKADDSKAVIGLVVKLPSLIKRPVMEISGSGVHETLVGFDADVYAELFQ